MARGQPPGLPPPRTRTADPLGASVSPWGEHPPYPLKSRSAPATKKRSEQRPRPDARHQEISTYTLQKRVFTVLIFLTSNPMPGWLLNPGFEPLFFDDFAERQADTVPAA